MGCSDSGELIHCNIAPVVKCQHLTAGVISSRCAFTFNGKEDM